MTYAGVEGAEVQTLCALRGTTTRAAWQSVRFAHPDCQAALLSYAFAEVVQVAQVGQSHQKDHVRWLSSWCSAYTRSVL